MTLIEIQNKLGCSLQMAHAVKELYKQEHDPAIYALRRVTPWLGKMIADGGHMNAVMPNDAIRSLQIAELVLKGT